MHQTNITREMVFRAMMARETTTHITCQHVDHTDAAASEAWEVRYHVANIAQSRALAAILDTLIDEFGLREIISR